MTDKINSKLPVNPVGPMELKDRENERYHERAMTSKSSAEITWPKVMVVLIVCAAVVAICAILNLGK